jgi:phage terminase Nu1 subunit (DNA packaging protein)
MSKPDTKSPTVDVGTLARLFSLTAVRVQQLAKDGIVIKAERGRYDLWASIRGYIKFLQERRVNQWDQGEAGGDWQKERARLTRAKADMAEMQAAILKGTVHEAKAVEAVWTDHLLACRAKLLGMPKKLAPRVHGQAKLTTIEIEIDAAITEALNELAAYDPALVTDRYVSAHRQELDASTEVDDEPMGRLDPQAQS